MKPWRDGVRALLLDTDDRVLLVHFSFPPHPWAPPGGGTELGESDEQALRRELAEEVGLDEFELGPLLWTREHDFDLPVRFRGQRERCYLVAVESFDPAPRLDLAAEGVDDLRWWTVEEMETTDEIFGPRGLPGLVRELLEHGPPLQPRLIGK